VFGDRRAVGQVGILKEERAKFLEMQLLHDVHLTKVEEREKELQMCLQKANDTLCGKSSAARHIFGILLTFLNLMICLS
jgi:hypothetical protein